MCIFWRLMITTNSFQRQQVENRSDICLNQHLIFFIFGFDANHRQFSETASEEWCKGTVDQSKRPEDTAWIWKALKHLGWWPDSLRKVRRRKRCQSWKLNYHRHEDQNIPSICVVNIGKSVEFGNQIYLYSAESLNEWDDHSCWKSFLCNISKREIEE